MHVHSKHTIAAILLALLLTACSTQKNTSATRAYHELTTRYNVYFNAEEAYNDALEQLLENHKASAGFKPADAFQMYPNSSNPNDTVLKQPGGPFDRTIEKTAKAIQEHSISAKPKRDRAQASSQAYRDWLRQNEFNPFIDQAWLLMGKAHVQNQDYTEAVSVFSQTMRLFSYDMDVVSEAQIWMMRAYTEMSWFSDAESLATTLQTRSLPKDLQAIFTEFYAFLLLRQENYREAIPHLSQTIGNQKNGVQKRRLQFLLGQIYARLGENDNAYRAFEQLKGLSTPYEEEFNALMAQSKVVTGGTETIEKLQKMTKSKKNAEHLDQIYAAVGNIYLSQNNTEKAIENYLLAESKSTRNGIDKALAQIALGDIYFDRKQFVKAEPRYTQALSALPEDDAQYPRVEFRAEVLGEMVPHLIAVAEQDSLQHLARLPEAEQLKIINAHIAERKKQTRDEERDTYLVEQQNRTPNLSAQQPSAAEAAALATRAGEGLFYFYNPQLVAQGKSEFRRRWGNRPLADNWRLQTIGTVTSDTLAPSPSRQTAPSPDFPEYYLQQLPVSAEAKAASNNIIEAGLYSVGNIAKDRLEDYDYAIETYNRHLADFPKSENRAAVYHQLHLIYLRTGNSAMARNFKNKIIAEYPESNFAKAMSDADYDYTMRNFAAAQDSFYQNTYQAYLKGESKTVRDNVEKAERLFSNGNLMPKFRLLSALSIAQAGDAEKLEIALQALVEKHPDTDESTLAQSILNGLSEGKTLAVNASAVSAMDWNRQIASAAETATDTLRFDAEKSASHSLLLLFFPDSVRKNELLFAVSDFNFSNFQLRVFSTAFVRLLPLEALQIKSFRSFAEARRYVGMIESDSVFRQSIAAEITPLIVSDANLELLYSGKSLNEYTTFYHERVADSITTIAPIKQSEIVRESEKIVPLEPEKAEAPVVVPQQRVERKTLEQRQLELEQKAEEALRQTNEVLSKKERQSLLKEREKIRKEAIKQRERELKQREKARKEELKQRERERRQQLKK